MVRKPLWPYFWGGYGRLTSHDADLKIEPGPHAHREVWSSVGEMRCSKYGAGFLHLGGDGWGKM